MLIFIYPTIIICACSPDFDSHPISDLIPLHFYFILEILIVIGMIITIIEELPASRDCRMDLVTYGFF